jgi:hypothetical protein
MSKKTKIVIAGLVAGFAAAASASTKSPTVTLGGSLDTQIGHQTQKGDFKNNSAGRKLDTYGIVNDTQINVRADGQAGCMKYGGLVVLNADTSNSKVNEGSVAHQTMMYVESNLGRLEAGSYTGAYDAMKVNGATVARATGGIDGDWIYWINNDVDGAPTATGSGLTRLIDLPTLPTSIDKSYSQNASKVSYYTPMFSGFRLGVSYIPDTNQHGTVSNLKTLTHDYAPAISSASNQTRSFKNVFQGGVSYKGKFDKVGFKFAALGEMGDAKKASVGTSTVSRKNLRAWELGAQLSYMCFSLSGSYGDWGQSGLAKTVTNAGVSSSVVGAKSSNYWSIGASYAHNHFGASFGYLGSKTGGFGGDLTVPSYSATRGNANVYSFGVDYKLAPGFMPYAEVTHFTLNDKTRTNGAGKNSGNVILAGSKLEF